MQLNSLADIATDNVSIEMSLCVAGKLNSPRFLERNIHMYKFADNLMERMYYILRTFQCDLFLENLYFCETTPMTNLLTPHPLCPGLPDIPCIPPKPCKTKDQRRNINLQISIKVVTKTLFKLL